MKSKTYVFADSVLCLGGLSAGRPVAEVIPTAFSLVQVVVILASIFQFLGNRRGV